MKQHIWRGYIILLLAAGAARATEKILTDSGGFASRYLPLIVLMIISLGIYGSIAKKPIFTPLVWKAVFWLSVSVSFTLFALALYLSIIVGGSALTWAAVSILVVAILFPGQLRIKHYAFRMPEVWQTDAG